LLALFSSERRHGSPHRVLLSIHPRRRYTSVINIFEFTCNLNRQEVIQRRNWLEDKGIRSLDVTRNVSETFRGLLGPTVACNLLRDLLTAATAKVQRLAVASEDTDFQGIDGILWVAEFAHPLPAA
jgi:predicted nucleic acid-binding protein